MKLDTWIEIGLPTIAAIFYAGSLRQVISELRTITKDHEKRLRSGGL